MYVCILSHIAEEEEEEERSVRGKKKMTTTTMTLPKFIALKSVFNNKYLLFVQEDDPDFELRGFLQYSSDQILSPYVKYEVERSKAKKGLVHLRSCYNNKYWVRASDEDQWIIAGADEPEEDQSKWSCTLFEPVFVDAKTVRFRHVQLGFYASLWAVDGTSDLSYFYAGSSTPNNQQKDVSTIIDWGSLAILPKHVAFKGHESNYLPLPVKDNYLSARMVEGHQYLQFAAAGVSDATVWNEVFPTGDGSVRIKSNQFGRFWRRSPNWIWADSDDSTNNNSDTLFWPINLGNTTIALRNSGNKQFCKRLSTEGKTNCLNAGVSTISKEAKMVVEEIVTSRDINNVKLRLMDARIYHQSIQTVAIGGATNRTQETKNEEIKLSYTEVKTSMWNSSVSLKLAAKTTIKTGVPSIVAGKIEILDEFNGEYQWKETKGSANVVEKVYNVTLPPMTKVTVSLLATKGSCDVPFSYSQHDTLIDGQTKTYDMDDGIYTGMNMFNFKYETKEEPI